jgi:hypothetical protein
MDNLQVSNGVMHWNIPFLRAVQDWDVDMVLAFFGMYFLKWRQGGENCIRWIPSKRKKFEVRSFFMSYIFRGFLLFLGGVFGKLKYLCVRVFYFIFCVEGSFWEDCDLS